MRIKATRLQARTMLREWEWLCFYIDLKVAVPGVAGDMKMNVYEFSCVHVPMHHPPNTETLFFCGETYRKVEKGVSCTVDLVIKR